MRDLFEKLSDQIDYQAISAKNALERKKEDAKNALKSESGAVDIVAILLIIVVVVALVWVFRKQLMDLVEGIFNNINQGTNGLGNHNK